MFSEFVLHISSTLSTTLQAKATKAEMDVDMPRTVVESSELLGMMNVRIATVPGFHNTQVIAIAYAPDAPSGANWEISGFRHFGDDHDQPECYDAIWQLLTNWQHRYDIL